jgi:hypothetical protein
MREGVYMRAELHVPREALAAWRRARLLDRQEALREAPGFDGIDMGDDDLLGSEISVKGATSLEEALATLRGMAFPMDASRARQWKRVEIDGEPGVRIEEAGPLPRDATVADLLAHLKRAAEEGEQFVEVVSEDEGCQVTLRGILGGYDDYRAHRLPIVYACAAAGSRGGGGRATFLGQSDGEFVTLFVDVEGARVAIDQPDPQNLVEEDWEDRLGGVEALDEAHAAWAKKARKKRRRAR